MPRRFVFRLEAVLGQRRRVERHKQRTLAGLQLQRVQLEDRIRQIQSGLGQERDDLRGMLTGAVDVAAVRHASGASLHGIILLQRAALELAGLIRRIEIARADLASAMVARKAVENLRAKQYEEWKREISRREDAQLDDLVVMRHATAHEDLPPLDDPSPEPFALDEPGAQP